MKLVIDLESIEAWSDETLAHTIKREVDNEIQRFVKGLVRDALKEHEKAMRALVKKTAQRDWKKVAKALEALESEAA